MKGSPSRKERIMDDGQPVTGGGPGEGHASPGWIGGITTYLVLSVVGLMAGFILLWPSCGVSGGSSRAATGLGVMYISPGSGKTVGGDYVNVVGTGVAACVKGSCVGQTI